MDQGPTVEDCGRRVRRLLNEVRIAHMIEHEALLASARRTGKAPHIDRRFSLKMGVAAKKHLVDGMEVALTELVRLSEVTDLGRDELRTETGAAIEDFLASVAATAKRHGPPGVSTETLTALVRDVLFEFDRGLYRLPGEPSPDVTVNVANVQGSTIGSVQQSGATSAQGGRNSTGSRVDTIQQGGAGTALRGGKE